MSHVHGHVVHEDKIVGYFEYNGTVDVAYSRFYDTEEEVNANWRNLEANKAECSCGQPPVPVFLYADYGGGYHWPSEACLRCHAITGERNVMDLDTIDGHPLGIVTEWAKLCRGE